MTERIISIDRLENLISVFGAFDENLHLLEKELHDNQHKSFFEVFVYKIQ